MKVKELMTVNPKVCTLSDSLADAAGFMWDSDCGFLPVVAEGGKVLGLLTDRDICMSATLKGRQLVNIAVEDTITGQVFSCRPDDDIRSALLTMQEHRVRRLPVVDVDGNLEGVLSMNDVVLKAEEVRDQRADELSYSDVIDTYKAICQRWTHTKAMAAGI